jgi:hypothetical protein
MNEITTHACWIIIDCWENQPLEDIKIVPNINEKNYEVANKISNYIANVKHSVVSCNTPVMPQFKNLLNVREDQKMLLDYMKIFNLKSLIYTGFHDGLCIVHKQFTGAKYMSKYVNCFLKNDLVCRIPELFKKTDINPPEITLQWINKKYFVDVI